MRKFNKKIIIIFMLNIAIFGFQFPNQSEAEDLVEKIGVGLGYPYLSLKYGFCRQFTGELRGAFGSGIIIIGGRGYYNLNDALKKSLPAKTGLLKSDLEKIIIYLGGELNYVTFDTEDIAGNGFLGLVFVGGEYFISPNLTFGLDFGPVYTKLTDSEYSDVSVSGIDFVVNLGINFYFDIHKLEQLLRTEKKLLPIAMDEKMTMEKTETSIISKETSNDWIDKKKTEEPEIADASIEREVEEKTEEYKLDKTRLLVANFDNRKLKNNLDCDFGIWHLNPNDYLQYCKYSFNAEKEGYSLKLNYDVDSPNITFNGFWMKLPELDLTQYKSLAFYVKGDVIRNFTKKIKVELKTPKRTGSTYINGLTTGWQEIIIPFSDFYRIDDWSNIIEFVIVFEDNVSDPKVGAIYLDDISFVK